VAGVCDETADFVQTRTPPVAAVAGGELDESGLIAHAAVLDAIDSESDPADFFIEHQLRGPGIGMPRGEEVSDRGFAVRAVA